MANFWPMRYPNGKSEQQFRSLLDYATNDPRPAYEVMKLMSTQISEAIVDTKCTSTHLYCIASRKNDGGQVTIFVINRLGNLTSSTNNTDDRVRLSINIPERQASRQYARATARALVASEDGQRFEETTIPVDKDGDDWGHCVITTIDDRDPSTVIGRCPSPASVCDAVEAPSCLSRHSGFSARVVDSVAGQLC